MQHDHVLKKLILTFDPTPRVCLWLEGSGGKIFATTFLHLWFNLICNLTMFLKSWIFTFWPQGQGMGVSGALGQNICYHGAAFMIPLNSICKMIMFWKCWILTFGPNSLSPPSGSFDMILIYCNAVCMGNWKYWHLTDLLRNLHIRPLTPPGGGGGVAGEMVHF